MLRFLSKKYSVFSLLKLLLVLGILLIILIAFFVVYPGVRDRNQALTEIANLSSIKDNINKLHASQGGDHKRINLSAADKAHLFPKAMSRGFFTATGDIRSSWGGAVNISNSIERSSDTPQPSYTIEYQEVPVGVCLPLVAGAALYFDQVIINGTAAMTDHSGQRLDSHKGGKLDQGKAAQACTERGTNTVEFKAR